MDIQGNIYEGTDTREEAAAEKVTAYDYSLEHVEDLRQHAEEKNMSIPEGFEYTPAEQLQECYNGIGPDRWSSRFRGTMTYALSFLESSALIHDWEYTYQPKTYGAFTKSNLRLAWNATKDGHPVAGITAGVLCQLFGWSGYKTGGQNT